MPSASRFLLAAAVSVAFGLGLVAVVAPAPAHADVNEGDRAPEFDSAAKDARGKKFRLKALRGEWVAVTLGASWCKPCKAELPAWDKLAKQYSGKLRFVAVNIDNDSKAGAKFMKKLKIKNLMVVYSPEDKTDTSDRYSPENFPTTYLIDPNGVVRHVHKKYSKGDEKKLAAQIDKLLKK